MDSQQIKKIRKLLGMTQEEFAIAISKILKFKKNLSKKSVYNWEKGKRSPLGKYVKAIQTLEQQEVQKRSQNQITLLGQTGQIPATTLSLSGDIDSSPSSEQEEDLLEVNNAAIYHRFREKLAFQDFGISESEPWPTANLTTESKKLQAVAHVRPDPQKVEPFLSNEELVKWPEKMAEYVMSMNDLSADVLDIITASWLEKAEHALDIAPLKADDFLELRGLKEQKSGSGRRCGYKNRLRKEIASQIEILNSTWITVFEMEVANPTKGKKRIRKEKWRGESRAIVVSSVFGKVKDKTDSVDPYIWSIRPGDVFAKFLFGPGRQTALLSQKALHYNPKSQKWEKRLARYLAYQWKARSQGKNYLQAFSVKTLLEAVDTKLNTKHPLRTRERLEKALNTLEADSVISGWQYEKVDESIVGNKGWGDLWLNWNILIEPPQMIIEKYWEKKALPAPSAPLPKLSKCMIEFREAWELTQMQAAEEIGISPATYCKIENGGRNIRKNTRKKVEKWLNKGDSTAPKQTKLFDND